MDAMPDSPAYLRSEGIEIVPVPDGYVAYDDARGMVHYLNPTAAIVLECCDTCPSAAEIARRVQAQFHLPAPPDRDVDRCLADLLDRGLIRFPGSAGPTDS